MTEAIVGEVCGDELQESLSLTMGGGGFAGALAAGLKSHDFSGRGWRAGDWPMGVAELPSRDGAGLREVRHGL